MPIYEYECQACGHYLEKLQKISDPPLTECPQCGEASLQKLISAAGFRLKGGGWYETDFKTGDKKNLSQKDAQKGGKSDSKAKSTATPMIAGTAKPTAVPKVVANTHFTMKTTAWFLRTTFFSCSLASSVN